MTGASLHVANLVSAGVPRWSVLVLDGSSSFELPTLSPDPLPAGTLDLVVTGTDMPGFAVGDFTLPAITAGFTHAAGDTVTFSH
jgi:hypothetical protein